MKKGSVYYFNPTCELAVANGSFSYMPPLLLQEMESDLAILPFIFCTENDFILAENQPSETFLHHLKNAGFRLPRFCTLSELQSLPEDSLEEIIPWAWSPAAHFKLKSLKDKCSAHFKESPVFNWKKEHRLLFERSTSLGFLYQVLKENSPEWMIDRTSCGKLVESISEIELMQNDHPSIVLKAPVSSSGRGIQIIRRAKLNAPNRQWISGVLKQQKYLIAEPYLEKHIDLSFQFLIKDKREVNYLGYSVFETNSNGQYRGTWINPDLETLLPENEWTDVKMKIEITAEILKKALIDSPYTDHYRGYLGIDALIFRKNETLMMQPCVEVNCRMNMGILSLELAKQLQKNKSGKFELYLGKPGEFLEYARANSRIIPLVEPNANSRFGAYISFGTDK